jgi:hypothetical protein
MVEPVDDRGLTPLTRIRPVKRDDKPRKQPAQPAAEDEAPPAPQTAQRKKRLGGNIDERA